MALPQLEALSRRRPCRCLGR